MKFKLLEIEGKIEKIKIENQVFRRLIKEFKGNLTEIIIQLPSIEKKISERDKIITELETEIKAIWARSRLNRNRKLPYKKNL